VGIYDDIFDTLLGGRYRVHRLLGGGAFGKVFLASHEVFGGPRRPGVEFRRVALKLFTETYVNRENATDVFQEAFKVEEIAAGARSRGEQPGLVTVFDIGTFPDYHNLAFLAMEFVGGGSLGRKFPGLPLTGMVDYARQICATLKLAHEANIIHRDLKPDNVLFTSGGCLKLTDFGIAIDRAKAYAESGVAGTIGYAPPVSGGLVTAAFDVYSMGVIMVEFLLGGNPIHQVLDRARRDGVAPDAPLREAQRRLAELDHPVTGNRLANSLVELREKRGLHMQEILRKCLHIDPEDRYRNAMALDEALWEWQRGARPRRRPRPPRLQSVEELLELARNCREQGALDEARKHLARADGVGDRDWRVPGEWARLHQAADDWKQAEKEIRRAMDYSEATPELLEDQAECWARLGKPRPAKQLRDRAARLRMTR